MKNNTRPVGALQVRDWGKSPSVERVLNDTLHRMDDGELYLQSFQFDSLVLSDGRLSSANFSTGVGFGLRAVKNDLAGFAHSNDLDERALRRAADAVSIAGGHGGGTWDVSPPRATRVLYSDENPIDLVPFESKIQLLNAVDAYARSADARVMQVSANISASWEAIEILRPGEERYSDVRPLVRFGVSVVLEEGGRLESGRYSAGGRYSAERFLDQSVWKKHVDNAVRQASINLHSVPAPAGKMTVVLGAGWPGVMLHEAVGHGLEGDAIRKGQSAYSGLLGEQVAARGVTVVDDGTMDQRRGSLTLDDEGTPTQSTVLIEDGVLRGFMHDRLSARLMGCSPTGNGRRQSYAYVCMPRMTNTYMLNGSHDPEEILASVKDGLYAVDFDGGQVDITSGNFVFSCTEAYRVRGGKVQEAVKGATLIGNGPQVMRQVSMVGNDLALDEGIATCGKNGQDVPVGVGQPTLRMDDVTVGGTAQQKG